MRSLYFRIFIASSVAVAISLGAFMVLGDRLFGQVFRRFAETAYAMQLDDAAAAYREGGRDALSARLQRMNTQLRVTHYLTDVAGRDLVTGEDRRGLLGLAPAGGEPRVKDGRFVFVRTSSDRQFHLIVTGRPPFTTWSFAPFYLLMVGSIVVVSWWVARSIVLPLRSVTRAAERFGRGDMGVRVETSRATEIATLAGAFNDMATRIETLLQAERRLLQDVSHELRSPLARLNFSTELARTAVDRGAAIDRIQVDLDRLSAVVTELIEMTRAEGDPAARRIEPVDLNELVAGIQSACARDADAHDVAIHVTGRVSRPLQADRELLRWGIENVVRNAVRYAPRASTVEVSVQERGSDVEMSVRDSGPGVPPELLARIFEPFYRVDEARTPTSGGMGLGLAIARRAILVHRGTIEAVNAQPGLRVTLVLPLTA